MNLAYWCFRERARKYWPSTSDEFLASTGLVSTATVTGQGASSMDLSVRGGDFSWPKTGTFRGHQRGHQLAITGDFLMSTDNADFQDSVNCGLRSQRGL